MVVGVCHHLDCLGARYYVTHVRSQHRWCDNLLTMIRIYVAYPKMARSQVAASRLLVQSMSIRNPTPDSVDLAFEQMFLSNSSYHPTLFPFNASFYLVDNKDNPPFASIETPELVASNGTVSQVPSQRVNITHPEEFTRYVLVALQQETFTIALRGTGDLQVGALPKTSVNYNNNITMKGRCPEHYIGLLCTDSIRIQQLERVRSDIFQSHEWHRS